MSRFSEDRTLVDSFETLTRIPSPDISAHPASSVKGKAKATVADDRPNLITTSSPVQIRSWAEDRARIDAEFRRRPGFDPYRNYDRVRADFIPAPVEGRNAFAASAINLGMNESFRSRPLITEPPKSPFIATRRGIRRRSKRKSDDSDQTVLKMRASISQLNIDHKGWADTETTTGRNASSISIFRPKTPSKGFKTSPTPVSETVDTKKSGLRKVTGLFKQKSEKSLDTTPLPAPVLSSTPEESVVNLPAYRLNTEKHLRATLNCPTYDYSETDPLPRHPNTARGWKSRNLKCTTCVDVCCALCGRACCAYKAAYLAMKTHKDNPESLARAQEILGNISILFPYGQEAPTFLRCSNGAPDDKFGCGKMICPDCCGQCPNPCCADIQCKRCKKHPFLECIWHDENVATLSFK
ncbi:hypothetical protein PV08_03930 [Exophiala spinifera]|uniref:Uncharacterized protein n=1 Tax=Exophiala spinifera TaxID=91928 RepID=A0A0D1YNQ4_9EURO|nr:uncharacterized protein PV08_03930 [Exophiala spinifera]KIW16741.1 hypothetical protein PV08_03930 [Exophiala spinifera]